MQRILFTVFVLVLLLAGCAAPGSAPEIEFTRPQVTAQVTLPPDLTVTSTAPGPDPKIEFTLPQVTPPVTPRTGWTVTYKLNLDILFQRPLELKEATGNSAYEFEGPNGSYLHFNDISGQDAIFGDTAEETCQKELESAARFEKKLGSKPYGDNPQLINLQIDRQPACLILPSIDQRADFQKRALLVLAYAADLLLEPGTPRYLSVTADSDHIQSIAETIRFIPRSAQAVDDLPPAAAFSPTVSGSLTLKNQTVGRLALDETYLYWTVSEKQDTIFRAPLNGGATEKIVTAKSKDGDVAASGILMVKGDWLVYLENDGSAKQANWELRAKNLRDGSEQVVLKGGGAQAYAFEALGKANLNVSVDQDWLAWSRTLPGTDGTCDESVLGLSNLRTAEQIELDRVCADQFIWGNLSLSGQTLVAEQDLPYARGTGSNLFIFDDFHSGRGRALTADGRNNLPGISDEWIAWGNASSRFGTGQITSVYERGSKTQRAVRVQGVSPFGPKLSGQWLYWPDNASSGGTTLYDLKRGQTWLMSAPQDGVLSTVTVAGSWIAWSRGNDFSAFGDSVLEWAQLP
jgi:hypothetical protein